jgi:hypothetical protein
MLILPRGCGNFEVTAFVYVDGGGGGVKPKTLNPIP